jgi:hypothetical protein
MRVCDTHIYVYIYIYIYALYNILNAYKNAIILIVIIVIYCGFKKVKYINGCINKYIKKHVQFALKVVKGRNINNQHTIKKKTYPQPCQL